nr:nicotinamide-nucleotide amidohydrolase family protein [Gemmatimonadota bacterium]
LLPLVRDRLGDERLVVRSRTLRTTGIGESHIADLVATIPGGVGDVGLAYLPNADGTDLRLTVRGVAPAVADAKLSAAAERLRGVVGEAVYGEDAQDLAAVVLDLCRGRGITIALAESCSGGMLGARLTAVPGSSDVVRGGVIAYDNAVKESVLCVPRNVIEEHGAVSEPVARAMATGLKAVIDADAALSITGIAGPGGGTEAKPVGTVWIALDLNGEVQARRFMMVGDRSEVRHRSAQAALEMLRKSLRPPA